MIGTNISDADIHLDMAIIQAAYRVFSDEGIVPLVRKSNIFIKRKIIQQLSSNKTEFTINGISATFDMGIVTTDGDFRHDFHTEKSVISSFIQDIEPNDIVYDIGANVGIYSSFAGQIVNEGAIICFEPHPVAVPVLYENLNTNHSKFEIVQVGLSDRNGYSKMKSDFTTAANINSRSGINIKLEKIVDIVEQGSFPSPTVAKIDVEGAELDVLRGFGGILDELELLYVEVHHMLGENFNSDKETIIDLLEDKFDSVTEIEQHNRGDGTQTHIKATSR